jgi:hypothetical protein
MEPSCPVFDDTVRSHTKSVPDEIPLRHGTPPFDVGGAGFESHDVLLLEDQLRGILDRHDPLRIGDGGRENVEQGRFSCTRTPRNQDVHAGIDHRLEGAGHFLG